MSETDRPTRIPLTDLARKTQKLSLAEFQTEWGDSFLLFQAGAGRGAEVGQTRAVELGATSDAAFAGFDVVTLRKPVAGSGGRSIGRLKENAIEINDPNISGKHASFIPSAQGWGVVDLASRNGTFVNDDPVPLEGEGDLQLLAPGDRITLGRFGCSYLNAERLMMMLQQVPISDD